MMRIRIRPRVSRRTLHSTKIWTAADCGSPTAAGRGHCDQQQRGQRHSRCQAAGPWGTHHGRTLTPAVRARRLRIILLRNREGLDRAVAERGAEDAYVDARADEGDAGGASHTRRREGL